MRASLECHYPFTRISLRGVAQPGSALGLGPRGRRFESSRPDHFLCLIRWPPFRVAIPLPSPTLEQHPLEPLTVKDTISRVGERLRGIDALRGGAALAVVLYHEVGAKPYPQSKAIWNWFFAPVWAALSFGYAGVFLFFVISGFCIHLQWAKRRR